VFVCLFVCCVRPDGTLVVAQHTCPPHHRRIEDDDDDDDDDGRRPPRQISFCLSAFSSFSLASAKSMSSPSPPPSLSADDNDDDGTPPLLDPNLFVPNPLAVAAVAASRDRKSSERQLLGLLRSEMNEEARALRERIDAGIEATEKRLETKIDATDRKLDELLTAVRRIEGLLSGSDRDRDDNTKHQNRANNEASPSVLNSPRPKKKPRGGER